MKKSLLEINEMNFKPELLNRRLSAKFLGISVSKLDGLKDIDYIKFGKRKLFSIETLHEYAKKHTVKGVNNE